MPNKILLSQRNRFKKLLKILCHSRSIRRIKLSRWWVNNYRLPNQQPKFPLIIKNMLVQILKKSIILWTHKKGSSNTDLSLIWDSKLQKRQHLSLYGYHKVKRISNKKDRCSMKIRQKDCQRISNLSNPKWRNVRVNSETFNLLLAMNWQTLENSQVI